MPDENVIGVVRIVAEAEVTKAENNEEKDES